MIEKEKNIKELYDLEHRNDSLKNTGADYENNMLERSVSGYLLHNDNIYDFLGWLQKMSSWLLETNLILRNFWNYNVDKYYNKHNN